MTPAEINDIHISVDEFWVLVTSNKGTCHVYRVSPDATSLTYNKPAYARVKSKLVGFYTYPRCTTRLSGEVRPRVKKSVEESAF